MDSVCTTTSCGPQFLVVQSTPAVVLSDRHNYLTSVAAQFGARGMGLEEVFAATQALNISRCKPPKPELEVRGICEWVCERQRRKRHVQSPTTQPAVEASSADAGVSPRSGMDETNTAELAGEIAKDAYLARDAGGRLYVFKDGVYIRSGELFVQQRVKQIMSHWGIETKWTSRKAKEVCEYVRVDAPALPAETCCVQNTNTWTVSSTSPSRSWSFRPISRRAAMILRTVSFGAGSWCPSRGLSKKARRIHCRGKYWTPASPTQPS